MARKSNFILRMDAMLRFVQAENYFEIFTILECRYTRFHAKALNDAGFSYTLKFLDLYVFR